MKMPTAKEKEGLLIKETLSYVYLGRSVNAQNDLDDELNRRSTAVRAAFGPLKEVKDHLMNLELRAHLFYATVLPALCYAAKTWADTVTTSKRLRTTHVALERFF